MTDQNPIGGCLGRKFVSSKDSRMSSTELLRTSSTNFLFVSRDSLRRFVYDDSVIGVFYVACRIRYLLAISIDPKRVVTDIAVLVVVS